MESATDDLTTNNAISHEKHRYAIMGTHVWGGPYGNLGVNALCCSLLRLIQTADPAAIFVLLGGHSSPHSHANLRPNGVEIKVPLIKSRLSPNSGTSNLMLILAASLLYRLLPSKTIRSAITKKIPWIGSVKHSRFVGDICGGDSFSDIYGFKRLLLSCLAEVSVILVHRSIVFFPQTYGPYKSRAARFVARIVLSRSSAIIARDKESQAIAQALVGPTRKVLLSPDVAFSLWATTPLKLELVPPAPFPFDSKPIGINVNGLMFNGGYSGANMFGLKLEYRSFLTTLVIELLRTTDKDIILVPHTITQSAGPESDNAANVWLLNQVPAEFKNRIRYVASLHDCHETKGIIGACDFFVGSRMHSCIAALSQGVPCVGVAYSMKFRGVFESVGSQNWVVDGKTTTNQEAISKILELYHLRESHRPQLAEHVRSAQSQLRQIFSDLVAQGA
jgi:colanic acid/amylovoran biosynthesis protein